MQKINVSCYKPRNVLWIEDTSVHEQYRDRGIGGLLLEECEKWARDNDYADIELNVYEFNRHAISFYTRHGFETVSRVLRKRV